MNKLLKTMTAIGIDLGTTFSCVSVYKNGKIHIIPNEHGHLTTPSWIQFRDKDNIIIGHEAKQTSHLYPELTIFDAKRFIGLHTVSDTSLLPFKVTQKNNSLGFMIHDTFYTPEDVSSYLLKYLKKVAENFIGNDVTDAVITVPAYFNDEQRTATKKAALLANLNPLRIINEPTAASIAYGLNKNGVEENILVFDLGGGTFDVTILEMDNGMFEVLATGGDTRLGGEDFDNLLLKMCIEKSDDPSIIPQLKRECEMAKIALSTQTSTTIQVRDFSITVSRAKFEHLTKQLFKTCLNVVKQVLQDAEIEKEDIHNIVLIGGSTRIPKIKSLLEEFFNKTCYTSINPDEAVAYGAAVQASILSNNWDGDDILLVDVAPLSLGIETVGGIMSKVIQRNTTIPTTSTEIFTTEDDYQTEMSVDVYEGERTETKYNNHLGSFELTNIKPALRGVPKLEVTFSIDGDGILSVSAKDVDTGSQNSMTLSRSTRTREIEKHLDEAIENRKLDQLLEKQLDAKRELEDLVYSEQYRRLVIDNEVLQEIQDWLEEEEKVQSVNDYNQKRRLGHKELYKNT